MAPRGGWVAWLRRFSLQQCYVLAIALGIFSLRLDLRRGRVYRSCLVTCYTLFVNIFILALLPSALQYTLHALQFFGNNEVMKLINAINTCVRIVVIALTLLFRWRRERFAKSIMEEFLRLDKIFFGNLPVEANVQRRFDRLFFAKFFSVNFQIFAAANTIVRFAQPFSYFWAIYIFITLNILHAATFHYFLAMLHIWQRFCVLNAQLQEMFAVLQHLQQWRNMPSGVQQLQRSLADQLTLIGKLHHRLTNLVYQLNDAYKYQIMAVLVTRTFNMIALGYFGTMMLGGSTRKGISTLDMLFGCLRYVMTLMDLYLVDMMYDMLLRSHRETAVLLKRFHELEHLDCWLERSCNQLSMQLMKRKLTINVCGMFNLDKTTSLVTVGEIIKHIVFLVQYDILKH